VSHGGGGVSFLLDIVILIEEAAEGALDDGANEVHLGNVKY
jgi:hypothetical protein